MNTIKLNDKLTITLEDDAAYKYRAQINGWQAQEPNNWIACSGKGSDGKNYTAWYFVSDIENIELDNIDYEEPYDVEDSYGNVIF